MGRQQIDLYESGDRLRSDVHVVSYFAFIVCCAHIIDYSSGNFIQLCDLPNLLLFMFSLCYVCLSISWLLFRRLWTSFWAQRDSIEPNSYGDVAGWVAVCHSRYCIKTTKPILKLFGPSGSPII